MGRLATATKKLLLAATLVTVAVPSLAAPLSRDGDTECLEPGPVLVVPLDTIVLKNSPTALGQWPLPLSASRPDLITEAQLKVDLVRVDKQGDWAAIVTFTFNDPKPLGLPFTFQKIQLTWNSGGATYTSDQDWSNSCGGPGVSLFPGQDRSLSFDLQGARDQLVLENPILRLWGSRN